MAAKRIEIDETGRTVAFNVTRHRTLRRWTTPELAAAVQAAGRDLGRQAITDIEAARRRVDVDDLIVLALVLDVSPATLLMPLSDEPHENVPTTGFKTTAEFLWRWLTADADIDPTQNEGQLEAFRRRSQPIWERRR